MEQFFLASIPDFRLIDRSRKFYVRREVFALRVGALPEYSADASRFRRLDIVDAAREMASTIRCLNVARMLNLTKRAVNFRVQS
jgi:hypothetical protein